MPLCDIVMKINPTSRWNVALCVRQKQLHLQGPHMGTMGLTKHWEFLEKVCEQNRGVGYPTYFSIFFL